MKIKFTKTTTVDYVDRFGDPSDCCLMEGRIFDVVLAEDNGKWVNLIDTCSNDTFLDVPKSNFKVID